MSDSFNKGRKERQVRTTQEQQLKGDFLETLHHCYENRNTFKNTEAFWKF